MTKMQSKSPKKHSKKSPKKHSKSPKKSPMGSPKRLSKYQEFVKKYARDHKHTGPHAGRQMISAAATAWRKLEGGGRISDFTKSLGLSGEYAAGLKKAIKGANTGAQAVGHGLYHGAVAVGNVTGSAGYLASDIARAFN